MDWRHLGELLAAGRDAYGELKNLCVWVKDNAGMGSLYRSQHELVFVFKHGRKGHRNNVQLGQFGRNRSNVWRYPGANSFARGGEEGNLLALHPTVKPAAMVADAILDCSARGEVVLDGFLGSGTTVIAAERTGRRCYGNATTFGEAETLEGGSNSVFLLPGDRGLESGFLQRRVQCEPHFRRRISVPARTTWRPENAREDRRASVLDGDLAHACVIGGRARPAQGFSQLRRPGDVVNS